MRIPLSARIGIYLILTGLLFDLILHYARGVEYAAPGIGFFSIVLFPPGLILLASTAAFQLTALRRERVRRIALTSPEPPSGELHIGRGASPSRHAQRIEIASPLRRSAWVGAGLVLLGITAFGGIQYWIATRTFIPVDMPISLAPGQVRTGPFRINLEGEYQIWLDASDYDLINPNCTFLTPFKVIWGLHDRGKVFASERQGYLRSYIGDFYGYKETYDLDLQVLSDSSCLNSGHPRLRIYTPKSDHTGETTPVLWLSALSIVVGLSLLVIFVLARCRVKLSAATDITDSESVSQYFQWAQRLPLKPALNALPSFGLMCSLVLSWLVMLHMVFHEVGHFHSKGLQISLPRPFPHMDRIDRWGVPLVLNVKAGGTNLPAKLYMNSKPLSWDKLNYSLRAELNKQEMKVVCVEADSDVSWQDALRAVDAASGLNAKVVLLTTESKQH